MENQITNIITILTALLTGGFLMLFIEKKRHLIEIASFFTIYSAHTLSKHLIIYIMFWGKYSAYSGALSASLVDGYD